MLTDDGYRQLMKHAKRLAQEGHGELAQHLRDAIDLRAEVEEGDRQSKIMLDSYADENQRISDERDRLRAEVERLTAVVKAANAQAEHFERQWYLRGDEVEALRAAAPDAQRFRWMRDNPASIPYRDEMDVWCVPYLVSNAGGHGGGVGESRHKSLDAAIDAAIKSGLK